MIFRTPDKPDDLARDGYRFTKKNGVILCAQDDQYGCEQQWMADPDHPRDWFTLDGVPILSSTGHEIGKHLAGFILRMTLEGQEFA